MKSTNRPLLAEDSDDTKLNMKGTNNHTGAPIVDDVAFSPSSALVQGRTNHELTKIKLTRFEVRSKLVGLMSESEPVGFHDLQRRSLFMLWKVLEWRTIRLLDSTWDLHAKRSLLVFVPDEPSQRHVAPSSQMCKFIWSDAFFRRVSPS